MDTRLLSLALLLVGGAVVPGQQYEGEVCRHDNGTAGVCTAIASCPWAQELGDKRLGVKYCASVVPRTVVCCLRSATPPPTAPITTHTKPQRGNDPSTTKRHTVTRPPDTSTMMMMTRPQVKALSQLGDGSKADRMCRQYSSYVIKEASLPILLPNAPKYNKSYCAAAGETLIVGGVKAAPKEFGHMAALGYGDDSNIKWYCGGSLISERFVLTAAHCTRSKASGPVKWVRLGDLDLHSPSDDEHAETIAVSDWTRHGEYKPPAKYNDIALLKLARDVRITLHIRPACLHTTLGNPPNTPNATASGWGKTASTEDVGSDVLMKVSLALLPEARCNHTYGNLIRVGERLKKGITPESMVCAGMPAADTCTGDSGGPLQFRLKDPFCMYSILGLTSFGVDGCGKGSPAVYTRVSHYISWIEKIVWP